jgi:Tfp pilus assembly protein PilE
MTGTRRRDRGSTLVELVVGMCLFAVLAAVATRTHVSVAQETGRAARAADRATAVRHAQYTIENQLRSADYLDVDTSGTAAAAGCTSTAAGTSCVRVASQYSGTARCVQWQVLPDPAAPTTAYLRTRGYSPTWASDADIEGWRVPARGLELPTAASQPFAVTTAGTGGTKVLTVRLVADDPDRRTGAAVATATLTPRTLAYRPASTLCSGSAP